MGNLVHTATYRIVRISIVIVIVILCWSLEIVTMVNHQREAHQPISLSHMPISGWPQTAAGQIV